MATAEALAARCFAPEWRTGSQLMQELRRSVQVLPTGCSAVDALLGGGLREGTVVEVAGETASGKTQLCHSATATTALRGEPVLYFDTTGGFAAQRVVQLAEAEAEAAAAALGETWAGDPDLPSRVLACISVVRPSNVHELLAPLDRLQAALEAPAPAQTQQPDQPGLPQGAGGEGRDLREGPRLVVVDSVSALLSTVLGSNQHSQGIALLTAVARVLKQLAERHTLAVLATNHVTQVGALAGGRGAGGRGAGAGGDSGGGGPAPAAPGPAPCVAGLKPALGEQWRPQPHMRVQLSVDDSQPAVVGARIATLTASPLQACGQAATFRITPSGLH